MTWPINTKLDIGTVAYIFSFLTIHEIIGNNGYLLFKFLKHVLSYNAFQVQDVIGIHHRYGRHTYTAALETFIPEFLEWKHRLLPVDNRRIQPMREDIIKSVIAKYGPLEISHFLRVSDYSFLHEMLRFSMNQLLEIRLLPFRVPLAGSTGNLNSNSNSTEVTVPQAVALANSPRPLAKIEMFLKALTTATDRAAFPAENIKKVLIAGSFVLKAILRQHQRITYSPKDIDIYIELGK